MISKAKYLSKSLAKFLCLFFAVSVLAGFGAPGRGNFVSEGSGSEGSGVTAETGQTTLPTTMVPAGNAPNTTASSTNDGTNEIPDNNKKGNSFFTPLVFLILVVLAGLGFGFILRALKEPKKSATPPINYSNNSSGANSRMGTRTTTPQNVIKSRPQVMPINPGSGVRAQIQSVERESIELTSAVETKSDSEIVAEPEQTWARVRPNLATAGIPAADVLPNLFDESSERIIVKPPQIGDPSSFAKRNWWDPNVEWCQLSPLGMTSDVTCDIGTVGSTAVAAASLRGNKHKVDAKPCQDAFNVQSATDKSGSQHVVSVLCDGMSSARHSHYGARRTAQLLSDALCRMIENAESVDLNFVNKGIESVLESCRQMLMPSEVDLFGASGVDPSDIDESDFNTTVTFLIASSTADGNNSKAIAGCIGDSPIFVLHGSEGVWEQIGVSDSTDELVNPATAAFPGSISIAIDEISLHDGDVLVAMSDGVGNFINVRGNQTTLGTYLAKQWSKPVNMATFVNDVSFDMKSADDDRTVVAIWQRM